MFPGSGKLRFPGCDPICLATASCARPEPLPRAGLRQIHPRSVDAPPLRPLEFFQNPKGNLPEKPVSPLREAATVVRYGMRLKRNQIFPSDELTSSEYLFP